MSWTDESVDTLKFLVASGLSASQIAFSLGGVTRNAVIGKVARLGLSFQTQRGGVRKTDTPRPAKRVQPSKPKNIELTLEKSEYRVVDSVATSEETSSRKKSLPEEKTSKGDGYVPLPEVLPLPDNRITVMMLNELTCRWPIGDPGSEGFTFCGRQSDASIPYCTAHARIAYQPHVIRKRENRKAAVQLMSAAW